MFYNKRNRKGSILVLVVLFLTTFIGIGGLVADFATAYSIKAKIKGSIDLAALAGISQLSDVSNATDVKNTAVTYLNNNLSNDIPGFPTLAIGSTDLTIQVGIYDFNAQTFTPDEVSTNANAVYIMFNYDVPTTFSGSFMLDNLTVSNSSVAAKQVAKYIAPGSGFPLVLTESVLTDALSMGGTVDLFATGDPSTDNSYWTDFTTSNPSTTDVNDVLNYIQYGFGTSPPGIGIGDTFSINDGGMIAAFMNLDPVALIGMTFMFPIIPTGGAMDSSSLGFVAATIDVIDGMGSMNFITITLMPGHIDTTYGGTSAGMGNSPTLMDQTYLAGAFTLVQ